MFATLMLNIATDYMSEAIAMNLYMISFTHNIANSPMYFSKYI